MSGPAFRFLHSSDWLLHQVCHGLTEVPEPLRERLIDAPFQAAQRVFDVAVAEQVNFLVLCGDLLHPLDAGPRGVSFLIQQFERLREQNISVYWVGGRADPPERWPSGAALPTNVTLFPKGRVEEVAYFLGDEPVATIVGRGWSGRGRVEPAEFAGSQAGSGGFRMAAVHGEAVADALAPLPIQYWALGGQRRRESLYEHAGRVAHYPGSPQGRCPDDVDAHGCTIVQVDCERQMHLQHVVTDVLRWRLEKIPVAESAGRKEIERRLRERGQQLAAESGDRPVLVTWRLQSQGRMAASLGHGGLAHELRQSLNQTLGVGAPSVWTVAIDVPVIGELPAYWYEEDTILGDFLRAVRQFQSEDQALRLQEFVGRRDLDTGLQDLLQISDARQREEVLREVALLGTELLRGDG
jgi:DNA repair protein SbcD/Mre11